MNPRYLLPLFAVATSTVLAADLPPVPAQPIAKKKELLFSDDFARPDGTDLGNGWTQVVPTFTLEKGALKGTQTRVDAPAADGKPEVKGHQAVAGHDLPTKDSVIEMRFKFAGAQSVTAEFDDRKYTGSHYGHICMVRVSPKNIVLSDQRDGSQNEELKAMANDPSKKEERAKRMAGKNATYPFATPLDETQWHTLLLETVGDTMRASVDGQPAGVLKSSGIDHPTKSKVEFGCMGKDGYFDDIKIWNAESAQP